MGSDASTEVVTGLADLSRQLTQLAPNVQKKLLRGALRAGMKITLMRASGGVHDVSGALRKSLRLSTRLGRDGVVRASVKAGDKEAYYAHMVEFGTAAHLISAAQGSALNLGGKLVADIQHPGSQPRPFMRPALDAAATDNSEVFHAVGAYLAPRIAQQLGTLPDEVDTLDRAP